jgi:hypothetical protein
MPPYDQTRYWTTHNSYEGGPRESIPAQLDRKVRCLELDVWDNDYDKIGDFRVGHFKPGHAVALGTVAPGNPNTLLLREWLLTIADWSANNDHGVITLVLDLKSDLTDNASGGDLEDLNAELEDAFGDSLFTRDDHAAAGGWPDTTTLRKRVLCVLSGNASNRASYRYCFGEKPALAVNAGGDVVLAYRSGAGDMRCWTGKAKLPSGPRPGGVSWRHKATYAWNNLHTVSEPSLAINDDGWIVSVHRVGPAPGTSSPALLECVVGELGEDGRILWHDAEGLGSGRAPSIELLSANRFRLVHETATGKSRRVREGTLNRKKGTVEWGKAASTDAALLVRDTATWKSHELRCLANARGAILLAFDGVQRAVGYRQVAFVELQSEEGERDLLDPLFYGASASNVAAIQSARARGQVARAWWFKQGDATTPPKPENFAATDHPFDAFYAAYVTSGGPTEA